MPSNISENYFGNQYGGIIIFSAPDYNLTIDNTNFTSNTEVGQGGIIYSERITTQQEIKPPYYSIDDRLSDNRVLINNTIFSNNKLLDKIYRGQAKGIVLYLRGNTIIDNTQFISNKYVPNSNQEYNEEPTGVIYKESDEYSSYFCDITNCDFINNDPENFIINNNEIVRNIINGHPLEDNYIPNYGDVSYYINGVEQEKYQLTTIPQEDNDPIVKVADLYVQEGYRIYKIIINQTEESKYYYTQNFHNNAYYFLMKNYNLT